MINAHLRFTIICLVVLLSEKFTSANEPHTCAQVHGELIHANEKVKIPQSCYLGLNASNCTKLEGYERGGASFCPNICSRKNTINSLNGQKMRQNKIVRCGSVSTDVRSPISRCPFLSLSLPFEHTTLTTQNNINASCFNVFDNFAYMYIFSVHIYFFPHIYKVHR
jgi:hypothetical protein